MLVLSRKRLESIVIGGAGAITVQVLSIHGDRVQLGIDAPRSVPVHRKEVYTAIHGGPASAAKPSEP